MARLSTLSVLLAVVSPSPALNSGFTLKAIELIRISMYATLSFFNEGKKATSQALGAGLLKAL